MDELKQKNMALFSIKLLQLKSRVPGAIFFLRLFNSIYTARMIIFWVGKMIDHVVFWGGTSSGNSRQQRHRRRPQSCKQRAVGSELTDVHFVHAYIL